MKKTLSRLSAELWFPALLLALWWKVSEGSTSIYFPSLSNIAVQFRHLWLFEHVAIDLAPSLKHLALGYALALALGVGLGVLLGLVRGLDDALRPVLEFARATPGVALLPLFVLLLGVGAPMKVALISFGAVWPILLNTVDGVRSVEPLLLDVARTFQMRFRFRLLHIIIPAASPQVFAGARTSLAIGVILILVSEMVGADRGIGYFVLAAQRSFSIPEMWSGILALGIVGYLLNNLFRLVEARALGWHRGMTQTQGARK
ncbi:MAG: ABC transporter permease subunit [Deltaproteobacteria bacterium]|nr:ABC transporter permease subunit [Deltaproteobacteria bacterium]